MFPPLKFDDSDEFKEERAKVFTAWLNAEVQVETLAKPFVKDKLDPALLPKPDREGKHGDAIRAAAFEWLIKVRRFPS